MKAYSAPGPKVTLAKPLMSWARSPDPILTFRRCITTWDPVTFLIRKEAEALPPTRGAKE